MNLLKDNIRNYRKANDLTQENLARDIVKVLGDAEKRGLEKSISQWENGISYPDINICNVLAKLAGSTLDDFLNTELQSFESKYAQFGSKFKKWTDEQIELFYHILLDLQLETKIEDGNMSMPERFFSIIEFSQKTENDLIKLSLKIGELSFEGQVKAPDSYWQLTEEWFEDKVLKYLIQQGYIAGVDVLGESSTEKGLYGVQIYLDCDDEDVKALFGERAKRQADNLIKNINRERNRINEYN